MGSCHKILYLDLLTSHVMSLNGSSLVIEITFDKY